MKLPIKQIILSLVTPVLVWAGPYAPPAGQAGSTAISRNDPDIRSWASEVDNYSPGEAVDAVWQTPEKALGPAVGTAYDIVSLGRGGSITLKFPEGISNGPGWDFVVFENSFDDYFLELAYVAVSTDGSTYIGFPASSLTASPVPAFGQVDATNLHNLAGKYRMGYGTPFDLQDLIDDSTEHLGIDLSSIRYVAIIDVVGDGSALDSQGNSIYDPYPTIGSAGFDLDAVGVRNAGAFDAILPEGSSWSYTGSIGWYVGTQFPWIYSQDQGWWYVTGNEREGLWLYDGALGWLWTSGSDYPALYSAERNGWLYFGGTGSGTRFFNLLRDDAWFDVPMNQ